MRALRQITLFLGFVGSAVLAAAAPEPAAFVSLHGAVDDTIEVGEPLFVAARFEVPEGSLVIAPAGKAWLEAVRVSLTGGGVTLTGLPVEKPVQGPVTLDEENAVSAEWYFPARLLSQLAPGTYVVKARLAVADGSGWKGETDSDEIAVRVVAPSNAFNRVLQRTAATAAAALAEQAPEEAARVLDVVLAQHPDEIRLLMLRARAAAQGGDVQSALVCVYRAGDAASALKLAHPPSALFELKQQLLAVAFDPNYAPTTPPAWTKPPAAVREPVRAAQAAAPATPAASPARPSASSAPATAAGTPSAVVPAPAPAVPPVSATAPTLPAAAPVQAVVTAPAAPLVEAGEPVPAAQLADDRIKADPAGQWATSATAGSQYSSPNNAAAKATGAPDVPVVSDSIDAWSPGRQNGGTEWLQVVFARPTRATEVRVRQTNIPGTISKLEVIDTEGRTHVWWTGEDKQAPAGNQIAWFAVRVPPTAYAVAKVKLTLNLDARPGWKQIDAVQLVSAP